MQRGLQRIEKMSISELNEMTVSQSLLLLPGCQTQTDRRRRLSEVLLRWRWLWREALLRWSRLFVTLW